MHTRIYLELTIPRYQRIQACCSHHDKAPLRSVHRRLSNNDWWCAAKLYLSDLVQRVPGAGPWPLGAGLHRGLALSTWPGLETPNQKYPLVYPATLYTK